MPFENAIQTLKNSPLRYLSSGSRELFHTDFLGWFSESYPNEAGDLFSTFIDKKSKLNPIKKVNREKRKIDLLLSFNNGQQLMIENKVKSTPYIEQLERYTKDNLQISNRLLIAFQKPNFINDLQPQWHFLSHFALSEKLQSLLPKINDTYHFKMLSDYIEFVKALCEVNNCITIDFQSDCYTFTDPTKDHRLEALNKLRLGDFYQKKKYEQMASKLFEEIRIKDIYSGVTLNKSVWKNPNDTFVIESGFSRSQGLLQVFYKISSKIAFGIQLQADQYRIVVFGNPDFESTKKQANAIAQKHRYTWFDFSQIDKNIKDNPKKKDFNKYGEHFLYRNVKVDKFITIRQLIQFMVSNIAKAKDFKV